MLLPVLLGCPPDDVDTERPDDSAPVVTSPGAGSGTVTDTDPLTEAEVFGAFTVTVHPDVHTLLAVTWTQLIDADATWLAWELDGEPYASPERATVAGDNEEVVLGVPAETSVDLVLHARVGARETAKALGTWTTGELPGRLLVPTLTIREEGRRPERWLLTSVNVGPYNFFGPCAVVILDDRARIVWYADVPDSQLTMFPKVSRRGGYITWDATSYYAYPAVPSIFRARLDLSQREEIEVPGLGLTYDELDDGSILFDEDVDNYQYWLTRQHPDGSRTRLWECWPWMSTWYTGYWGCAPNTVLWDEARGTVVWSMFETSTVVEIDVATGSVLREFGRYPGGFEFDPAESALELQHYPNWTADGTLIVSTHVAGRYGVQVAREFEVDDAAETLREVWSYTPEAGWFAEYAGQVQKLPSSNVLWQFGTEGVVQEVTQAGEVVWEITWQGRLLGNVTPIADMYEVNQGW